MDIERFVLGHKVRLSQGLAQVPLLDGSVKATLVLDSHEQMFARDASGTAAVDGREADPQRTGPDMVPYCGGDGAGLGHIDMPRVDPLKRLREIRDQLALAEALIPERDELIRRALRQGSSERKVADAAGLSQPRISEIAGDVLDE